MNDSEMENDATILDDEYEEVVVEEPDKGKKKRSFLRFLTRLLLVFLILAVFASTYVYFVAKEAFHNGGYVEKWVVNVDGEILKDVRYGERPQQEMDVYIPQTLDPAKANGAILFIHGGAWISGSRWEQEGFAKMAAKEGYLVGNMDYTLYNLKERNSEYNIELVLEDVRLALTKLVEIGEQHDYHVDRVALSGHSAGGHLSMLYGFRSRTREDFETPVKIAFVAPRVGPVDFHAKTWGGKENAGLMAKFASFMSGSEITEREFLNPDEKTEKALVSISPLYDVKPGVPPTLAAYGAKDSLVPDQHYKLLKHAFAGLKAKSVSEIEPDDTETQVFDLLVFPNSNHLLGRDPDYTLKWRGLFLSYAARYLTTPVEQDASDSLQETGSAAETSLENEGAETKTEK